MLMTGKEYLQSIRDGRVIYVGKERVKDQTTHPAFAAPPEPTPHCST